MADGNFILTQEGKDKLEEELHFLETEKRAEIGEDVYKRQSTTFEDVSDMNPHILSNNRSFEMRLPW